jgi:pimeloyl-ACP methyl ester carboxylesterase
MERRIAGLIVDVTPPERPKFKSPLILIHGLWSGSWCWNAWATHFCNLGWECWAINFPGRTGENNIQALQRLTFQDCLEELTKVIAVAPAPPVLVGHDLGGLLAQKAAEEKETSGVVLVSTLPPRGMREVLPRAVRLLRLKYWSLLFLGRPFLLQEKDFRRLGFAPVDKEHHLGVLRPMVPDSSHLIKEFFSRTVEVSHARSRYPVLIIAAGEDRVVPVVSLREVAQRVGADFKEYSEHGHGIIGEEGGQEIARDIHRWIVQKLGEKILLADFNEPRE